MRFRDQSLKLVQYALKLIHPFYLRKLAVDSQDLVLNTQSVISNSRKIFRLFKSISHIANIYQSCQQISHTMEDLVVKILRIMEDCLWVLTFEIPNVTCIVIYTLGDILCLGSSALLPKNQVALIR